MTAQFHYPRYVTKVAMRWLRRIAPNHNDSATRWALAKLNRLEGHPLQYLTGLFIVARAEKPLSPQD